MAYKTRVNKKTGKTEYKVRYYFYAKGIKRDSETGWFPSLEKAEKEAEELKKKKELEDELRIQSNINKKLDTVFYEYVQHLKEEKEKKGNTTSISYYKLARTVYNKHIPTEVRETKIKDIDNVVFRTWLTKINKESKSGSTIRNYKLTILRFNDYLNDFNYYSNDYIRDNIYMTISRVKLKASTENNRIDNGERHVITFEDLEKIENFFINKGLGSFKNFYYYTLYYVLFFSGVRPEELTGLQWKHIRLDKTEKIMCIYNSISRIEDRKTALKRTREGVDKVKTRTSKREIPIFDIYYQLLLDYYESYQYNYDVTEEEAQEGFVFPCMGKKTIYECLRTDTALKELKRVIKACGIANTDLQMFRHSCATYMILPKPKGLGYSEEQVINYFGHSDTTMLRQIYAKINFTEKREQMQALFSGKEYNVEKTLEKSEKEKKLDIMQERMHGKNEEQQLEARKDRIFSQIKTVIKNGKTEYKYKSMDREIIEQYIQKYGKKIEFIEV